MGEVVRPIRLNPDQFFFGFVKNGETAHRIAHLRKNGTPDMKILRIESNHPDVTADFKAIKPGVKYEITVTFTAPASETGKSEALIKIHTNDNEQPLFEVPFYAIVK